MTKRLIYFAMLMLLCMDVEAQPIQPSFDGVKKINGVFLHVTVIGEGKPLLVLHGGPGMSHDYFLPYLEPLAKKYKLIFYDQRASGRSEIPEDSLGSSYTNMINDIDSIRAAFGLNKINILAHSWASILAINYAEKHPNRVASLIFSDPINLNHEFDQQQQESIKDRWKDTAVASKAKELKMANSPVVEIRIRLAFLTAMSDVKYIDSIHLIIPQKYADAQNSLYHGMMSEIKTYDRNYYAELKTIKAPTLIIHGKADNVPLAASEKLKASLPASRLVVFDESGHFPFIEETDKYNRTLMQFLDEVNK